MALDIHRLDNNEWLWAIENNQYNELSEIFEEFTRRTGLVIEQYGLLVMSTDNQKVIIKIVDKYIEKTDLNKNKKKTFTIIQFGSILQYFCNRNIDLKLVGD